MTVYVSVYGPHFSSYSGKHPQGVIHVEVANIGGKLAREVDGRLFFDSKSVEILGVEVERQPVTELSHRLRPNPSDGKYKVQFNAARMPPKLFIPTWRIRYCATGSFKRIA